MRVGHDACGDGEHYLDQEDSGIRLVSYLGLRPLARGRCRNMDIAARRRSGPALGVRNFSFLHLRLNCHAARYCSVV